MDLARCGVCGETPCVGRAMVKELGYCWKAVCINPFCRKNPETEWHETKQDAISDWNFLNRKEDGDGDA